ncbi:MAG: hypothetical protein IPK82_02265 [Polyangiaceae bacterium]|nr:hypothetical protein [Polyangiaceae bacterium]
MRGHMGWLRRGGNVGVLALVGYVAVGCGEDPKTTPTGGAAGNAGSAGNGGGGSGQGGQTGGQAGDIGLGGKQGGTGGLMPCVATSVEGTLEKKPVDIMFIIDNSGSMGDNINAVQNNINQNFAAIIGASGIDYRVIMISEHGALGAESICIGAPLSTSNCNPVPAEPGQNPPIFYQYSVPIGSHNSVCQALSGYDGTLPDQYNYGPGGWKQWLRKEAFKVFVEVTDDGMTCTFNGVAYDDNDNPADGDVAAKTFDAALLALDPEQFGTDAARNYVWHSIIGLAEKAVPTEAYAPTDPVATGVCGTAVASGTAYQVLSQVTGGLRFPICEFASFDVVFQEIAKGVIAGAKIDCALPVPEPPPGETIDLATVVLEYTPGNGGAVVKMSQVGSAAMCKPDAFYIENNVIQLCPDACALVQSDDKAKIDVLFGCSTEPT